MTTFIHFGLAHYGNHFLGLMGPAWWRLTALTRFYL